MSTNVYRFAVFIVYTHFLFFVNPLYWTDALGTGAARSPAGGRDIDDRLKLTCGLSRGQTGEREEGQKYG